MGSSFLPTHFLLFHFPILPSLPLILPRPPSRTSLTSTLSLPASPISSRPLLAIAHPPHRRSPFPPRLPVSPSSYNFPTSTPPARITRGYIYVSPDRTKSQARAPKSATLLEWPSCSLKSFTRTHCRNLIVSRHVFFVCSLLLLCPLPAITGHRSYLRNTSIGKHGPV